MNEIRNYEYDVIVVGSGAAGLTAAVTAKQKGLSVLLIEKTDQFGGSTALSGGAVWIPNNIYLQEAGLKDTAQEAEDYLNATVGDSSPKEVRVAYLERGIEMIQFLRDNTRVHWSYISGYSDYYPTHKGGKAEGRSIEAELFNLKKLGKMYPYLRRSQIDSMGMVVMAKEFHKLNMVGRTFGGMLQAIKVGMRFFRQTLSFGTYKPASLGEALIARLMRSYQDLDGEIWLSSPFTDLIKDTDGSIVGIELKKEGQLIKVKANKGVIFGSGGFSHNQILREKYLPHPTDTEWTLASEGQTGDFIEPALRVGAKLAVMDRVWGTPTAILKGKPAFMPVAERAIPGMIIVDQEGNRYQNEVTPYHEFVDRMYGHIKTKKENKSIPSWFIFDQRSKNRYLILGQLPFMSFPKKWTNEGFVKKADSIEALAKMVDVSESNLKKTIAQYNKYVKENDDKEFKRGQTAHDRFYGDPKLRNPNLQVLDKAPFYAIAFYPGDIGTKGGVTINKHGQVLDTKGRPIKGLYAAGNASAAVMGNTYPGPGATIGPAMVFGYLSALHIAEGEM